MGRSDCCGGTYGTSFHAKKWRSLDGCGTACILFSISLHLYASSILGWYFVSSESWSKWVYCGLYLPCTFMALWSLYMTYTTNPGAVPMGARPLPAMLPSENKEQSSTTKKNDNSSSLSTLEEGHLHAPSTSNQVASTWTHEAAPGARAGIRRCRKCNDNYKPPRAHHDSVTGRCIVKMDHYCPWVCNAIGALNHKFFFLFILYTFLVSVLSAVLLVLKFVQCGDFIGIQEVDLDEDHSTTSSSSTTTHKHDVTPGCPTQPIILPFASMALVTLLFFNFTLCMLFEQYHAITDNTGKIARMKMQQQQQQQQQQQKRRSSETSTEPPPTTESLGRVTHSINEMFGGTHPYPTLHWFLPTPVTFATAEMQDEIMGFVFDPNVDGYGGAWKATTRHKEDRSHGGSMVMLGGAGGGGVGGAADSALDAAIRAATVSKTTTTTTSTMKRASSKVQYSKLENQED